MLHCNSSKATPYNSTSFWAERQARGLFFAGPRSAVCSPGPSSTFLLYYRGVWAKRQGGALGARVCGGTFFCSQGRRFQPLGAGGEKGRAWGDLKQGLGGGEGGPATGRGRPYLLGEQALRFGKAGPGAESPRPGAPIRARRAAKKGAAPIEARRCLGCAKCPMGGGIFGTVKEAVRAESASAAGLAWRLHRWVLWRGLPQQGGNRIWI